MRTPAELKLISPCRRSAMPGAAGILDRLGLSAGELPFAAGDVTAGSESELQTAVVGDSQDVDLPRAVAESNYYANILRRVRSGDTSPRLFDDLQSLFESNGRQAWEHSWVRLPRRVLGPLAEQVLRADLQADKRTPAAGPRGDVQRFFCEHRGEPHLRLPVSYLVKLALADAVGGSGVPAVVRRTGERLMEHYLNDNTSPETFSFHVVGLHPADGMGRALARETGKRFLLTQLLTQYANARFELEASGQKTLIYFAPHPPVRMQALSRTISDSFYRELFMSPCLSGWDEGEKKNGYMQLCHQVLSRSQLNAVGKLREAGIVTNNLVVLPSVSNASLANNGTHVSLGSRALTAAFADPARAGDEKLLGDLAVKIFEHFLPLFVGTYSAAPYRLGFEDFHPERALGFLPHQLDYTHLRMLWRRWRKKAQLSFFGHAFTPFGPERLDRGLSRLCGLRGDFVPDFRIIDYPTALLSSDRSPALDGRLGNQQRLKEDLADLGIFDRQMSLYLPCKLREAAVMGFSGFEARHYSLFPGFEKDMGPAVSLQTLIFALAFRYMAAGDYGHRHIPDTPVVESERRQVFFAGAIGLPTFYVRRASRNRLLRRILEKTGKVRISRRYPGYLRVQTADYQQGLVRVIEEDGADLVASLGLEATLADLKERLAEPERASAAGRLTRDILIETGARSPMQLRAEDFNRGAETYYRGTLRRRHLAESLDSLEEDLSALEGVAQRVPAVGEALHSLLSGRSARSFLQALRHDLMDECAGVKALATLIRLTLLSIHLDMQASAGDSHSDRKENDPSLLHRA